jgi:CRISPR/Cas system-associated exonuclease Cas4 (RecB family)
MSKYHKAQRTRNIYYPGSQQPFKLSRSKLDLFLNCPRCFYLDRRLGVSRPAGFPFNLNSAVDTLLKKEFDIHRAKNTTHPLMKAYKLDLVPFQHEMMDVWRENFKGVQYLHEPTNFIITGAVDDLWVDPSTSLGSTRDRSLRAGKERMIYVVDYKATSKLSEVTLDADWQIGYKRQMEIYQWLLRQNGFKVSATGYFVYCNGKTDRKAFDAKLEFDIKIIPYNGDDSWVEGTIIEAHECLIGPKPPLADKDCDYCNYFEARKNV